MSGRSGDTARVLILVGLVLQVVSVFVAFGLAVFFSFVPFLGGLVLVLAFLGLVFVFLVYFLSYTRAAEGDYEGARTPTLVFAILSLLSLGLISGILYLIAYVKLGDAADEWESSGRTDWILQGGVPVEPRPPMAPSGATSGTGYSPASGASLPSQQRAIYCTNCGQPTLPQARFCRNCGARLQ